LYQLVEIQAFFNSKLWDSSDIRYIVS